MKLTHLAHLLTLVLLAITAWLAYQATEESRKANAKMDRLTAQQTSLTAPMIHSVATASDPSLLSAGVPVSLPPEAPATAPTASASLPPPPAAPSAALAPVPVPAPEPTAAALAAAGTAAPSTAPVTIAALGSLTPLQKRVKDAMSLGKVKDVVPEHGFVTFQAPGDVGLKAGQQFDLRRNAAVVGRITIASIEPDAIVANLDPKSVPAGLSVQSGDEIISVIPTH